MGKQTPNNHFRCQTTRARNILLRIAVGPKEENQREGFPRGVALLSRKLEANRWHGYASNPIRPSPLPSNFLNGLFPDSGTLLADT